MKNNLQILYRFFHWSALSNWLTSFHSGPNGEFQVNRILPAPRSHILSSFLEELEKEQLFSLSTDFDSSSPAEPNSSPVDSSVESDDETGTRKESESGINTQGSSDPSEGSSKENSPPAFEFGLTIQFLSPDDGKEVKVPSNEGSENELYDHVHVAPSFYQREMSERQCLTLSFPASNWRKFERLYQSLGYLYHQCALPLPMVYSHCHSGAGLRGLLEKEHQKLLVEVITYHKGMYGRFLVLVTLGIGCVVWYNFTPGIDSIAPSVPLFGKLDYSPFLSDMDSIHHTALFDQLQFLEQIDPLPVLESAFENLQPFSELEIPVEDNLLKAARIGMILAFLLTMGIVPHIQSGGIECIY